MEFSKLSAPSLKELFVRELESMILSGRLPIGTQLPPERDLAGSMQVSRAVVNSGIVELARKGFLVIRPRVGTFVADYRRNGTIETFLSIVSYNGGMLRNDEVRSILELRIALDKLAVELCSLKITDDELANLRASVEALGKAKTPDEAVSHAFAFQHQLALYSNNTLLPVIFSSFKALTRTLWLRYCTLYGISSLYENTRVLFSHLEKRDFEGAIQSLTATIQDSISGSRPIYY
ncbi:MAG: GntR family transcriptional regulator [Clostridia bacterium]|nr:GntR family transcriptional regulator [Clostridia bacterium]